jgi:tetratricopeptide (TPR) repeat protein
LAKRVILNRKLRTGLGLQGLALRCMLALAMVSLPGVAQFEAPPTAAPVQDAVRFEVSETLFTAMAAINAVGYDEDIDSTANHPARRWVREQLKRKNPAVLADIKRFYEEHRQRGWQEELSQYLSFALLNRGAPDFEPLFIWNEMPPDAQDLRGFEAFMKLFYEEADVPSLWREVEPQFEPLLEKYQPQVADTILKANAYLRNPTSGATRRSFQIVLDVMGAPNRVETRAYDDLVFVVVTPTSEFPRERLLTAYLHYLVDPAVYRFREQLEPKRAVGDFALAAPTLGQAYKEDFMLLASASLVRAIAARMDPMPTAQREAMVRDATQQGFVLTPFFYEELLKFEKQPANLRFYFEEMVKNLDPFKENERLKGVTFLEADKQRVIREAQTIELSDAQKRLEEAEGLLYEKKDFAGAKAIYLELSQNAQQRTMQSRAYFGLARIAVLQRETEAALELFQRALEYNPDPSTKAWSLIYLGRLADVEGDAQKSAAYFEAALQVNGLTKAAKTAAEKGLEQARKGRQ